VLSDINIGPYFCWYLFRNARVCVCFVLRILKK
jgi:hypothetical protein